eukprot:7093330-Prymnesium_polylepis.1
MPWRGAGGVGTAQRRAAWKTVDRWGQTCDGHESCDIGLRAHLAVAAAFVSEGIDEIKRSGDRVRQAKRNECPRVGRPRQAWWRRSAASACRVMAPPESSRSRRARMHPRSSPPRIRSHPRSHPAASRRPS